MSKSISVVFIMLLLVFLPACENGAELVEPTSEKEPYWWRNDPFFDDKKIDEEATLALGDPNVVIGASMEEPDEMQIAYNLIADKIAELLGAEHVTHVLYLDHAYVRELEIPGVNMDTIILPEPPDDAVYHDPCTCPTAGEDPEPQCENGGGNAGSDPPPPPPDPEMTIDMRLYVCNGVGSLNCSPRTLEYKASIDAPGATKVLMMFTRVMKEGVTVYEPNPYISEWGEFVAHRFEFFISGPKKAWQGSYTGRAEYTWQFEEVTQGMLVQNFL